jgi:dTDP-4-amino-4,6-dideoxygalactose transaminase
MAVEVGEVHGHRDGGRGVPVAGAGAIPELTPRQDFIPFALPSIGDGEIAEVVSSLQSGWVTTGPKVREFEAAVAARVGAGHGAAVSSCTAGLHLSLHALGVGPGDEVVVPTMTFCASANVVEHLGATPVLVDVGPDLNVTPEAIRAALTERTKAIMPVHFGGQAVDLHPVYELAHRHGLAVVEDAAHAIGSTYRGVPVGCDDLVAPFPGLRRATVFSFYATKNMTTGEGGMVVTDDEELAARVRVLSLHGMSRDAWKRYTSTGSWFYEVIAPGFKANMTDVQAAIGLHQLSRLPTFIAERNRQADAYDAELADLAELDLPVRHADRGHAFHLYVVRLDLDRLTIDRAEFIEQLRAWNVGSSVHFIPVHLHPFYREKYGYQPEDLPVSTALYERIVSIPIYPGLGEDERRYVSATVRRVVAGNTRSAER